MIPALSIALGLLGIASIVFWILAIPYSYRIERLRKPDLPKPRLAYTNIFATAFWTPPAADPAERELQTKLRTRLFAALGCLITMALLSFALPVMTVQQSATAEAPAGPPPVHAVGTTLSYVRSNQSGTQPETILVHIPAAESIHVAKMAAACTDAAYVTAKVDPAAGEVTELVGGRLQRDSTQLPQAFLALDASRKLVLRLGDAAAEPLETPDAPPAPWRMYDFDLAEFALLGPRAPRSFEFGLALAWPDGPPPLVRILGAATAKFLYSSESGARHHFQVSGPAFSDPAIGDRGGELITDATYGHVIEARLGRPNHSNYSNFQLKLTGVAEGAAGAKVWADALAAHWANCPAETP